MRRALGMLALLLAAATPAGAATEYLGLQPGWAKTADAARVLGDPVMKLGDILHEHKPQEGTGPIFVEYRLGGDVVDRIEVKLSAPIDRAAIVEAMKLASKPARTDVLDGVLTEFFGDGASITLKYASDRSTSGVTSIGYQSDTLFDRELERAARRASSGTSTSSGGATPPPTTTPPAALGSTAPPSVRRNPAACYDVFVWADAEEAAARRGRQTVRRQKAMAVRLAAQSGDCERAKTLVDEYRKLFPVH